LTGGVTEKKWETLWNEPGAITPQKILAAKSYADWLGLWFAQNADSKKELLVWRIADDAELAGENVAERSEAKGELPGLDDETKQKLKERLSWQYQFGAATIRAAKSSVTALRHQAEELADEAERFFSMRKISGAKLSAAAAGTAAHRFLQYFSFEGVAGLNSLEAEAERLERENVLSADEREVLDLKTVAVFWNSEPGKKILEHAANVKRELAFTAKFSPAELSEITGTKSEAGLENEFVVVQGVADLVVLLPQEIWLVDFKTDEVRADGLPAKIKIYEPQLKLYASALVKIYSRPVTNCWLHFLSVQKTVDVKI
jgi:ATP-dependent helicase/nuclease subunit A